MKKFVLLSLLSLFILGGCGPKPATPTTTSSDTETKISQSSRLPTTESSSLAQSSTTEPANSTSEGTATTASTSTSQVVETEEQAVKLLIKSLDNKDLSYLLWEESDKGFVFKVTSKSIAAQGGSGTVGFFQVAPDGSVTELEAAP